MRPAAIVAEDRVYRDTVTGQRWHRVTSVLDHFYQSTAAIPAANLLIGRERGTAVHDAVHFINGGVDGSGLDRASLHPELQPYIRAFDTFTGSSRRTLLASEEWIAHPLLPVAGTTDEISEMRWRDKPTRQILTFIDYKSGAFEPWHPLQLSAYAESWRVREKYRGEIRRVTVYLQANGQPDVKAWTSPTDWPAFAAFVQAYARLEKDGVL